MSIPVYKHRESEIFCLIMMIDQECECDNWPWCSKYLAMSWICPSISFYVPLLLKSETRIIDEAKNHLLTEKLTERNKTFNNFSTYF